MAVGAFNVGGGDPANWAGSDPLFEIGNGMSDLLRKNAMTVRKNGNVEVGGSLDIGVDLVVDGAYRGSIGPNNGAPFPRPAYDSGWVSINQDQTITLTHNIGSDVDNYVVDMTFKKDTSNIHVTAYGGIVKRISLPDVYMAGAAWGYLTSTTIQTHRFEEDDQAEMIRIRIWVYN